MGTNWLGFVLILITVVSPCGRAFVPKIQVPRAQIPHLDHGPKSKLGFLSTRRKFRRTELFMVFDYFKKRAEEGLEQLSAFASGLEKSRNRFLQNVELLFTGSSEDLLEELTDILLQADLGMQASQDIVEEVKSLQAAGQLFRTREDLMSVMRGKLLEGLETQEGKHRFIQFASKDETIPTVLFIMGANGMGKTTTIGKLANRLRTEGDQRVLLAACDTFRAAAADQLQTWATRAEVDCFAATDKDQSATSVLRGALEKAINEKYDIVMVDTSGRLSNNVELTEELIGMKKLIQEMLLGVGSESVQTQKVPHETLLVLDAAQGRMALDSAKIWDEEIGLSGLILTKLDGSARGGSVVAISRELGLPVKLIGVGEGIDDLRDFEPDIFVDGLLGIGAAGGSNVLDEGRNLEARLVQMRKARDAQAEEKMRETKQKRQAATKQMMSALQNTGNTDSSYEEYDDDELEIVTATSSAPNRIGTRVVPSKSNKKKKKRKKK